MTEHESTIAGFKPAMWLARRYGVHCRVCKFSCERHRSLVQARRCARRHKRQPERRCA